MTEQQRCPHAVCWRLSEIDHLYPHRLSQRLSVPRNYMFIGTPGDRFPHRIEKLGGVRVIL